MRYDKQEMIDELYRAKEIVSKVYDVTDIYECGNVMCDIDETIGAIESSEK